MAPEGKGQGQRFGVGGSELRHGSRTPIPDPLVLVSVTHEVQDQLQTVHDASRTQETICAPTLHAGWLHCRASRPHYQFEFDERRLIVSMSSKPLAKRVSRFAKVG